MFLKQVSSRVSSCVCNTCFHGVFLWIQYFISCQIGVPSLPAGGMHHFHIHSHRSTLLGHETVYFVFSHGSPMGLSDPSLLALAPLTISRSTCCFDLHQEVYQTYKRSHRLSHQTICTYTHSTLRVYIYSVCVSVCLFGCGRSLLCSQRLPLDSNQKLN